MPKDSSRELVQYIANRLLWRTGSVQCQQIPLENWFRTVPTHTSGEWFNTVPTDFSGNLVQYSANRLLQKTGSVQCQQTPPEKFSTVPTDSSMPTHTSGEWFNTVPTPPENWFSTVSTDFSRKLVQKSANTHLCQKTPPENWFNSANKLLTPENWFSTVSTDSSAEVVQYSANRLLQKTGSIQCQQTPL